MSFNLSLSPSSQAAYGQRSLGSNMAGAWDDASPSPNIDTSCAVFSLYERVPILASWCEQLPSVAYCTPP